MVDVQVLLAGIELAALVEQDLGQPVRREGRWLKWTCPFHVDGKTPSLGVGRQPLEVFRLRPVWRRHRLAARA